jgi:hypothetical protein
MWKKTYGKECLVASALFLSFPFTAFPLFARASLRHVEFSFQFVSQQIIFFYPAVLFGPVAFLFHFIPIFTALSFLY